MLFGGGVSKIIACVSKYQGTLRVGGSYYVCMSKSNDNSYLNMQEKKDITTYGMTILLFLPRTTTTRKSEALYIQELGPSLNIQNTSYPKLFKWCIFYKLIYTDNAAVYSNI